MEERLEVVARRRPRIAYGVAVGLTAAAIALRLAFGYETTSDPGLLVLFLPILASAYIGGLGPGLVATLVAAVASNYFLIPPRYGISLTAGAESAEWIALIVVGALVSALAEALHRSRERIAIARHTQAVTLAGLGEGVITVGDDLTVRYLNREAERLTGRAAADARDKPLASMLEIPGIADACRRALEARTPESLETTGAKLPLEVVVNPLPGSAGAAILLRDRSAHVRNESLRARVAVQDRLTQVAATAPRVICLLRPTRDGEISLLYAGPGFESLLGISPGEAPLDRVLATDAGDVRREVARAAAENVAWRQDFRVDHPTLGVRWIAANAVPEAVDGGGWSAFMADVTEHRESAAVFRERAALLDLSSDAVFARDAESDRITYWSEGAVRLYGFDAATALGRSPHELLGTTWPESLDATQRALAERGRWDGEVRHNDASGREIVVLSRQALQRDGGGAPVAILEINTDITDRTRFAEELQRSKDRFRTLVEAAPDIVLSVGADGLIDFAGPQVDRLGYEPHELVGRSVEQLVPARLRDAHRAHRTGFAAAPATRSMGAGLPLFALHRDGREIPVEVSLGPASGGATTVIVADVSNRRELESRLRQAERLEAIGRLAGGVAHDFNNLLTVITGYGTMARQDIGEGSAANDITEVLRAAERASRLTGQLLAFSRQQVLDPTDLDLATVTRETLPMLNRLIGEDIRIVLLADDALPLVNADRGQIEQIIVNLAVNGRDAMPNGGTLTIEAQTRRLDEHIAADRPGLEPGTFVCLTVTDTGTGIAPEALERIFEPFFTTKEVGHGTGLGLATVHGIVTQSGGHVQAYSEEGFGTSFKVYLPIVAVPDGSGAASTAEAPRALGGDETVLVCEDEPTVRALMGRVLARAGYTVLSAPDPHQALQLASELDTEVDVLVSDVVMPGMPGPELAERIQAIRPGLRTLFISGYTAETVRSRGGLPMSSAFLEKPFVADDLLLELRMLLDRSRPGVAPSSGSR